MSGAGAGAITKRGRMKRRTRAGFRTYDHGEPMRTIDTRPMAFVFGLVALVMLFAASQPRTHVLLFETWIDYELAYDGGAPEQPNIYTISLNERGDLLVDNNSLGEQQFANFLTKAANEKTLPIIRFHPHADAPYGKTFAVMGKLSKFSLLGEQFCIQNYEEYRHFNSGGGTSLSILTSYPDGFVFVDECLALTLMTQP